MPRFNILLRDDKSQLFVRIDMKSEWPTVSFTRNPADDTALYFGPYYNGYAIKKALRYLRKIFPYYTKPPKEGARPDLDAHIGLSPHPGVSSASYKEDLKRLIRYIEGGRKAIVRELEKEMHQAAKLHDFENAARLRNNISDLRSLQQKIMFGDKEFLDISKDAAVSNLVDLLGLKKVPVRIEGYDVSHMGGTNVVASMVVFRNGVSDRAEYRKFKTRLEHNNDFYNMNETIGRRFSEKNIKAWGTPDLVVIDGGKGQLDAALKARDEREIPVPFIGLAKREEQIVIEYNRSGVVLNEAFMRSLDGYVTKTENYLLINLSHSSHIVKLLQRIRDESHRFAVSYHTVLKRAGQNKSGLDDIPGIGPVTKKQLLKHFGSLKAVREADETSLVQVVGAKRAALLKQYL